MPLGIYPTVDYVFKLLFGDPANADLLIHLLNAVLQPKVPIVQVTILNPFLGKDFDEDKDSFLDVLAEDETGRKYNIEMQTTIPLDLGERLLFYASKLLANQLEESQPYSLLRSVYSICFLTGSMFPQVLAPHLRFVMTDGEHGLVLTEALQVHLIELIKYNSAQAAISHCTPLEKWAYFLKYAARHEAQELRQLLPESEYQKATGVIEMISQSPEQRLLHEARLRAQRDRASAAEYAERCREIGLAEGREEGFEKGRQEGRHEGLQQGELIGEIKFLQRLLGETRVSHNKLTELSLPELERLADELRARFKLEKSS